MGIMQTTVNVILAVVGTYGVATLVTEYDGPFKVFAKLRSKLNKLKILDCATCLSVWVAIPISFLAGLNLLGYLAVVGAAVLLTRRDDTW